ncbi:hypothetical protein AVEN_129874-1, partial [Araneus ventricosus]
MSKRPSGTARAVGTPENVECVRQAVLRNPCRSASSELDLSNRS